jgi:hypothetical protein
LSKSDAGRQSRPIPKKKRRKINYDNTQKKNLFELLTPRMMKGKAFFFTGRIITFFFFNFLRGEEGVNDKLIWRGGGGGGKKSSELFLCNFYQIFLFVFALLLRTQQIMDFSGRN